MDIEDLFDLFGLDRSMVGGDPSEQDGSAAALICRSPIDGANLARLRCHTPEQTDLAVAEAERVFLAWRQVPAPLRGQLVRLLGDELRSHKDALGHLVTLETGKILQEGLGEVQEMIDICDFAVGLSRQLHGLTIASERPGHRMAETWHPLGPVGLITAFNFPVAVWSWNTALALVCGCPVVWKPSDKTPLTALACQALLTRAASRAEAAGLGPVPDGLVRVVLGGADIGARLTGNPGLPLISATGSTAMGRQVGAAVAARLGRCLLELGGNNAMIVAPSADLGLAVRAILFAAVGTAGQRCTSLRRLIAHEDGAGHLLTALRRAYASVRVGDPRASETLVGPLIDEAAWGRMQEALEAARAEGGRVHGGERVTEGVPAGGVYVRPALVEMPAQTAVVREETFAPILYVMTYSNLEQAIARQNGVPQGLSSSLFSTDLREVETFLSPVGSDCGLANVNIGPSGAEIGGAFGGEKDTGGGRESGSDAWKVYMRRQTQTVNFSSDLPLAQGIAFRLD